ncbi:MAG: hypothetical protein HS129_01240 [Leptospiraceae bacterium]|nr:hypothetical protein [Leptospiraceae bacterium]NUM41860.1 hypothetical protein [Leptospiraceae bacterium]
MNDKPLYYSFEESNSKIIKAFAAKDSACGTHHNITSFMPGKSRKVDIDTCVKVISAIDCNSWNSTDPTPIQCKNMEYRIK